MDRLHKNEEKRKARLIKKGIVNKKNNPFRYNEYINRDISEPSPNDKPKHGYDTFRYTRNQRRVETGEKRYRELRILHQN